MSTTVPEERSVPGKTDIDLHQLRAEVEEVNRLAEQTRSRFDSARHFAGLLEDPFVQKLVQQCGFAIVLAAMREARAKDLPFAQAVAPLGADCSSEPIANVAVLYGELTAGDFDHYTPLLRAVGGSIAALKQQILRAEEVPQRAEQAGNRGSARHFAGLLEDPFVQKLVQQRGLAIVLMAMRKAREKGRPFTQAVARLGAVVHKNEPIVCADFCYGQLTAGDFDHYTPLLRAADGSASTLEQQEIQTAKETLHALQCRARAIMQRIDAAIADNRQRVASVAERGPRGANGKHAEALLTLSQEARVLFQRSFLLSAQPTTDLHTHQNGGNGHRNRGNHNGTHSVDPSFRTPPEA